MRKLLILVLLCGVSGGVLAEDEGFTGDSWRSISQEERAALITNFIDKAKEQGIIITGSALHYCDMLDTFYEQHPEWREEDVGKALKTLMIMEYDWEEPGVDKDELARSWLSEEVYKANKARFQVEE